MKSNVKIFGLDHLHENTSIKFTESGLSISTGLNVSPNIALILDEHKHKYKFVGKVIKASKMRVYKLAMIIPSALINNNNIISAQETLLRLVQIDINKSKEYFHHKKVEDLQFKMKLIASKPN